LKYSDKRFCVYFYKQISTNKIVYVGHGSILRPYAMARRDSRIVDMYKSNDLEIILAFDFLSKKEAEVIEGEYLDEYLSKEIYPFYLLNKSTKSSVKMICYEEMKEYFYYSEDSETFLRWKKDRKNSNGSTIRKAGDQAGCLSIRKNRPNSYAIVRFKDKSYPTHRIIYCIMNCVDVYPDQLIDHIDGDGTNNCITNLRIVSAQGNALNTRKVKIRPDNKTGVVGVSRSKGHGGRSDGFAAFVIHRIDTKKIVEQRKFSISKYGEEEAFRLACEWREQKLKELENQQL
jgi:hypothetical protein